VRLLQLLDAGADASPARLKEIAIYANGVGPNKLLVIPMDLQGRLGAPTSLVRDAHAVGLFVHVWTLRRESQFLPPSYDGDFKKEFRHRSRSVPQGVVHANRDDWEKERLLSIAKTRAATDRKNLWCRSPAASIHRDRVW